MISLVHEPVPVWNLKLSINMAVILRDEIEHNLENISNIYCTIAILIQKSNFNYILPRKKICWNSNRVWQWRVIWCSHEKVSALLSLTWIFKCIDRGYVKNTLYFIVLLIILCCICKYLLSKDTIYVIVCYNLIV